MTDYKIDDPAVCIGDTQSGKTTSAIALCQMHNKWNYITPFVNTKGDRKFYDINGLGTGVAKYINVSIDQYIRLLNDYTTDGIIEIRPDILEGDVVSQIEPYLKETIAFKKKDQEQPILLAIDELHRLQAKAAINRSVQDIWTMGKGLGLFGLGISQRGTHINNDIWTQSEWFFIHKIKQRDLKYYHEQKYLSIPGEWLLPKHSPECTYPWRVKNDRHKLFIESPYSNGLRETPLRKPPF